MNSEIDKVYIINLKSRPDRRKHMSKILDIMKIPKSRVTYVDATDRNKINWKKALKSLDYNRPFDTFLNKSTWNKVHQDDNATKGQIGNFLSHLRVWNQVARQKPGKYLILEDDICPTKYWFKNVENKRLLSKVGDAQFIYLGDCFRDGKSKINISVSGTDQKLIRMYAECLHAYMITNNFGRIIVGSINIQNEIFPLKLPSDRWLPGFLESMNIPFYNFKIPLVIQHPDLSGNSNIEYENSTENYDTEQNKYLCVNK